ncbi:TonB-dependent receptor [Parasphingorhabdus flavimaris]|uniref:TonB-dependent receptor n=1 Tax=Parasphingorhabdus flavimaris TaxID=266812 RepID=A0ABX2N355_9SPHN|nr:TonB-dependent receptor [Parasphingorhabdus flavimaris]NVD28142.1 TonB-dependent receptor [Parasphingorhabdus flavimaris]|tara:strand:+ start:2290 stop:4458 length:2169 start_codon:yes stop_codon:yes gene_type:complete
MKLGLLLTTGALALAATSTEVRAQAASGVADDSSNTIVVTARKREERAIDAPLSVQVFSAVSLERDRVDNVEDLVGRTPNLSLSSNVLSPGNDFLNIAIRGVGAQGAGVPAVGTFVDGAFVPSLSFDIGFMDVERVEVLRGPQGTLFGRNTQGGALNIVLRRPDEETRGRLALTFDEFESARAQAALSGQISDNFFGSIAADVSTTNGYLRNNVVANAAGANGQGRTVSANASDRYSGRLALRYNPDNGLDINLAIDGSRKSGLDGYPGVPRGSEDYIVRSDFQIDGTTENIGGALTIENDFGNVALTLISAFRDISTELPFDFDGSPERGPNLQDIQSEQTLFSQEVRLDGGFGDRLSWLVGAYAFREDSLTDRSVQLLDIDAFPGGLTVDAQRQDLTRDGFALFADLQWRPVDWLEIGGGLRYARESVDSDVVLDFALPGIVAISETGSGSLTDSNISPTVSIRANLTDDLATYARYARGFKAGGFPLAPASATTNISFGPETSDNYEIGLKGSSLGGILDFNFALFRIDLSDQQLSTIVFLNGDPNLPVASVGNAGSSRSEGFELDMAIRPSPWITLGGNVGYTDATYRSYLDTVGADRSGERFPFVPEWTAELYGRATIPIGDFGDLTLGANFRHVGDILSGSGVDVDLQFPVQSYEVLDLTASLEHENFRLDLFVDNVTDEFIETRVFNAFFFADPRPFSITQPPRRFGFRIVYDFR